MITANAIDINRELEWLKTVLRTRSDLNTGKANGINTIVDIPPPVLNGSESGYAQMIKEHDFSFVERFLIILASAPHLKPELLDVFLQKNKVTNQLYSEFGGRVSPQSNSFIPTGETAMFVLAGDDLSKRFELLQAFEADHVFARQEILRLEAAQDGESELSGHLSISREVLDKITTGTIRKPTFSSEFPARLLTTQMEWDDLVLSGATMEQIEEIKTWLTYKEELLHGWGLDKILTPGYKALFYGAPGTGKSLTAALLGKKTGLNVYRIDLSQMVSKYIGETE